MSSSRTEGLGDSEMEISSWAWTTVSRTGNSGVRGGRWTDSTSTFVESEIATVASEDRTKARGFC